MTIQQGIQYIKNPYIFSHNENPIDGLDNENYADQITSSVKPIEKSLANIEAEQNEVLFEDGKLYNILGKPHSKGGTPLNASEGSFIFSKFAPLAFNRKDKKLFELDAVRSDKRRFNSPAQILKKEINIKHHNKMFKILDDKEQDEISKASAHLMLAKNLETIGKIGYLQEEKKNFPTGIPAFSNGTTPIVNNDLENKIMQSSQFMKLGGMKKYEMAGEVTDPTNDRDENGKCRYGTNPDGSCIQYSKFTQGQKDDVRQNSPQVSQFSNGYKLVDNVNGTQIGERLLPPTQNKYTGPLMPNADYRRLLQNETADHKARRLGIGDNSYQIIKSNNPSPATLLPNTPFNPGITQLPLKTAFNNPVPQTPPIDNSLHPNDGMNYSTDPFNSNAQLTPIQNANTGYLLGQAMNTQKFVPMRPQIRSNIPFVETMDYQPVLNQIDNSIAQQYDAGRFSSSPQQGAIDSLVAGKALQAKSQAIGQVNAQNVGLRNQQRQMASQVLNGDNRFNIEQNAGYYDKTQMADNNYATLKQAGINATIGDLNNNNSMLDKFKQLEASQKMGQQYIRNDKNLIEVKDKNGKSTYVTDEELKANASQYKKDGSIIQTRQVPLFSTDKYGRVVNNRIDVNPLAMAGPTNSPVIGLDKFLGLSADQRKGYNDYYAMVNGKYNIPQQQPQQIQQKYGGKVPKKYTVKNPFN